MSLYNQLSELEQSAVCSLLGFIEPTPGFRNNLRKIPALKDGFTLGQAAMAYLLYVASQINK